MSFSLSGTHPLFPSLLPTPVDPLWHKVDVPKDEDAELARLEKEYEQTMKNLTKKSHQPPIGTANQEPQDDEDMEDEDEDDNDNDDNEDSDSREEDDDVEMDMNFGQESPVNVLPS